MRKAKQVVRAEDSLPEGDKEKQILQGLLASKERVVRELQRERLFE